MARSSNQKLKLLYLYQFLLEKSDEKHPVTINEMIQELERHGVKAERKSLYDDIELLQVFGADILREKRRHTGYYIATRDFELAELKLLVDLVQSSKFLSNERSLTLIQKIETLCSKHDAAALQSHVNVQSRVKNSSRYNVYYNVDSIYNAILQNNKIQFLYFKYNVDKNKEYRRDGEYHVVSPVKLLWDDENYYLICIDDKYNSIRHYRVDRMEKIEQLDEERQMASDSELKKIDDYASSVFSMFDGDTKTVKLVFDESLSNVALDRFGNDVIMIKNNDGTFTINCEVAVSGQFFGWLTGIGDKVKIAAPEEVAKAYKEHLQTCLKNYDK